MKEDDNIINLCDKLEKEINRSNPWKVIEVLRKSLSIAAGMLYDIYATCPEAHFPIDEIIVKKICVEDVCVTASGKSAKCWEKYLIEKARVELEEEKS